MVRHNEGGGDGRVWDFTNFGEGLRNTINLFGRNADHGNLHWTANFDEVQDFEGQIRDFAGGTGLMTNADFTAGTLKSKRKCRGDRALAHTTFARAHDHGAFDFQSEFAQLFSWAIVDCLADMNIGELRKSCD